MNEAFDPLRPQSWQPGSLELKLIKVVCGSIFCRILSILWTWTDAGYIYIYTYIYFIGYYHALFHKLVVNITEAYGLAKRLGKRVLKFFVAACGCLFGVT